MKSVKTRMFAALSVPVMALSVVIPSFVGIAQADPATKTVYIDVEKNVLHENLLKQPIAVTLSDTSTILDATKQVYGASNVGVNTLYNYVEAFADTDTNFAYDYASAISTATGGLVYRTDLPNQPIVSDSSWLREKEYNGISGWMFTVNNAVQSGGTYYTATTPLSDLPDGAVIRWEFSEASGADLGMTDVYLPTQTTAAGYYDWTTNTASFAARFTRADKTDLISAMADYPDKTDTAYTNALNVLKNLTSTQSAVDTAAAAL